MSQDADTTLSGATEHAPNSRTGVAAGPGEPPATSARTPAARRREDWAGLAARLHDELVGLLTRRPDAAADLAPALELAGRLRAEGERSLRWIAVHGPAGRTPGGESGDVSEGGGSSAGESDRAAATWLGFGLLDEFAAVPRERLIRRAAGFERERGGGGGGGSAPGMWSGPMLAADDETAAPPSSAIARPIPDGIDDAAGRRFVVEGRSLHEYALDSDRPPVSVSQADYERIARAFASLCLAGSGGDPEPTQAKPLREATGDADRTRPLEPRLVSLTHVYICLRLWQATRLVGRQTGGWFVPLRMQTGDPATAETFVAAAMTVWRSLAQAAEPTSADAG